MITTIMTSLRRKPFFYLLLLLLACISIASLKPEFFLAGWDNYSSYLNIPANISRTFFATWREHRGLGVPSDSEVTDLFRQLFYIVTQPIVGKQLVDQLYFVFSLNLGVLVMYALAQSLFRTSISRTKKHFSDYEDIFSFVAAFLYLCNLNTLAVFYFPIQPFITRFFTLPATFLLFHIWIHNPPRRTLGYGLIATLLLFCSTSFVIGTVFLTLVIGLALYLLFQPHIKRGAIALILFFAINAFWLLPFINYTLQKSSIIRLAPTFIEANETQLNKAKSYYSLENQILLFPSFFETKISSLNSAQSNYLHPLAESYQSPQTKTVLYLLPVLALLGIAYVLYSAKQYSSLLWLPGIYLLFLFLSMKEFSPLGFIYTFLNQKIPLFGVIFRFGDTKFHPMLAFSGSLLAALGMLWLIQRGKRIAVTSLVLIVVGASCITFRSYFTGKLIGFFMYNAIPSSYTTIAQTINNDERAGRVLHLPYDSSIYWRSYSWGYIGSEFFGFMLKKPLIEKTFEPASMENAYLHKRIQQLIANSQVISKPEALTTRATDLYHLLTSTGTRYIVFDETVSATMPSRGAVFWGNYPTADTRVLLQEMLRQRYLSVVQTEYVDITDYMRAYPKQFPLSAGQYEAIARLQPQAIVLYEVKNPVLPVSFLPQAQFIDPTFTDVLASNVSLSTPYIQLNKNENYTGYPFMRLDNQLTFANNTASLTFSTQKPNARIGINETTGSKLITISAQITNADEVLFKFFLQPFPVLALYPIGELRVPLNQIVNQQAMGDRTSNFANNWHILPNADVGNIRMRINNTVLPIPLGLSNNEQTIGSVMVNGSSLAIDILKLVRTQPLLVNAVSLTENPNCFNDKQNDYVGALAKVNNALTIEGANGSTCTVTNTTMQGPENNMHAQLRFTIEGQGQDSDALYGMSFSRTSKPKLKELITQMPKPLQARICIQEEGVDNCFNSHQLIEVQPQPKTVILPIEEKIFGEETITTVISAISSGYQSYRLRISNPTWELFTPVLSSTLTVPDVIDTWEINDATLTFPLPLSPNSFYFQPGMDGWYIPSNNTCGQANSYRTIRTLNTGIITFGELCSINPYLTVPFSSNGFYLFQVNYNLASGQFPVLSVSDSLRTYLFQRASLQQGYPDIAGFKVFQNPEFTLSKNKVETSLNNLYPNITYTYLYPLAGYQDTKDKQYAVHQYSENESVMALWQANIIELPGSWATLSVSSKQDTVGTYALPKKYTHKRLLPSLVAVTIEPQSDTNKPYLLVFHEGYDTQWGVYPNIASVLMGLPLTVEHGRCNGYANCYVVPAPYTTVYLFYWPERLALLGWIITLLAVLRGLKMFFYVPSAGRAHSSPA